MRPIPGTPPTELSRLVRAEDRVSFIYLERCVVHRQDNALTAADDRGVVHIPAATLGAVMLGPGTRVSHQAMTLLADSGSTVVWVGSRGALLRAWSGPVHVQSTGGSTSEACDQSVLAPPHSPIDVCRSIPR